MRMLGCDMTISISVRGWRQATEVRERRLIERSCADQVRNATEGDANWHREGRGRYPTQHAALREHQTMDMTMKPHFL
jgi:hypothetical protein